MPVSKVRKKLIQQITVPLLLIIASFSVAICQEEFNGPLSSWANVKTRFGAKGDGIADDTKAFQRALDSLSDRQVNYNTGARGYSVVYIPSGKYKITSTLVLRGKIGIKIVGEDPAITTLLWQGNENDTIFWANGSAYFSMSRLSWDAGGKKNMEAIGIHWKTRWREQNNISSATVNIEIADMIFREGFARGISGGTGEEGVNQNDSEVMITRCIFYKCTVAGISIRGYNALDYWIWYCRFIQCNIGVSCNSGNYHLYNCYFKRSGKADMENTNCYYASARFCYSSGSNCFSFDNGKSSNPFKRIFQRNIILNPSSVPIQYYHTGKITLLDNYCRVPANSTVSSFLVYDTWAGTYYTLLELGNVFENIKKLYTLPVPNYKVYRSSRARPSKTDTLEKSFLASLPATPKFIKRKIFSIPPSSTTQQIQEIMDRASALEKRAVVHFPFGMYNLDRELTIRKGSDIQITGDGMLYATMLLRKDRSTAVDGSIFKIYGPSSVSIKDLNIQTKDGKPDNSRAIGIFNADQPGSVMMLDQIYSGMDSSLIVLGYNNLTIQKTNSFFSGGNYLSGGSIQKSGKGSFRMLCYGAQFANTQVWGNSFFMATDCWWEGDKRKPAVFLEGEGTVLIQGAMVAPGNPDSNTTALHIGRFSGRVGLMDLYTQGNIKVEWNNPSLELLLWNINFYHKKRPLQFLEKNKPTYKAFMGGITSQCFNPKDPDCQQLINTKDEETNISDAGDFIADFVAVPRLLRPLVYSKTMSGSNIFISRVSISTAFNAGIVIR